MGVLYDLYVATQAAWRENVEQTKLSVSISAHHACLEMQAGKKYHGYQFDMYKTNRNTHLMFNTILYNKRPLASGIGHIPYRSSTARSYFFFLSLVTMGMR